ncbi:hypothetical protein D477_003458 [Arthrobacter crystallopoietes BAB-32]|uniref:Uncharacterized protein n=1 Tax=Arthrobacter crystallopoietes BAB-32 TaxID=1246476 RepID=N1V6B7_9MICC|nr:hypothetical protein D477_003458 [Arthrobacter crystallopoietes BAB-32]
MSAFSPIQYTGESEVLCGVSTGALVTKGLLAIVGAPLPAGIDVLGPLPDPAGVQPISTRLPSVRTDSHARNLCAAGAWGRGVCSGEIAAFLRFAVSFFCQSVSRRKPGGADVRETSLAHWGSMPGPFRALSTGLMHD